MAKSLTAKEIYNLHQNPIRTLNLFGRKKVIPENSEDEVNQVNKSLHNLQKVLSAERVEKRRIRAEAVWLPDIKKAKITRRTGNILPNYGQETNNEIFLRPEEALFLLEMNRLELLWNGVPFSIEQGYTILLSQNTCTIDQYRIYQELALQGFRVQQPESITKRQHSYENIESKKMKLDNENFEMNEGSVNTENPSSKTEFSDLMRRLKAEGPSTTDLSVNTLSCYNIYSPDTSTRSKMPNYKLVMQSDNEQFSVQTISTNEPSVLTSLSGINSVAFFQLQKVDFDNT